MAREILGVFAKHAVLPRSVAVGNPLLATVLEPIAAQVQLTVEADAPLRGVRKARRAMERHFRQ